MRQTQTKHDTTTLEELTEYQQWVAWDYSLDKTKKAPINPHNWMAASATDPSTWGSYEDALAAAGSNEQVGFMFSADDPFTGIDLDNCIDLGTGEVAPWANDIAKALDSYTEVSPSNTGLKIWVKAHKPGSNCRTGDIEIYDHDRFFTFTGRRFHGYRIKDRQTELEVLYHRLFPDTDNQRINTVGGDGGGFSGEDRELLDKARNANRTGELFAKLYDWGDWRGFKSQSEADMRLCGMLAYWTGCDEQRMDRLFRGSTLARTIDRHSNSDDYLDRTITTAIKNCNNVYDPNYKAQARSEVGQVLEGCMERVVSDAWEGRSGPTERDVYRALINMGLVHGRVRSDGVRVSASERDIALAASVQRGAARRALRSLEERGLIKKLKSGGSRKASTYLTRLTQSEPINNRVNTYGYGLGETQRIRNPSPAYGTIGKRNGQILDYVHALGRAVTLEEVADHLGARKDHVKARNIALLLELDLLEAVDNGYVTPADIELRLERELRESGCVEAERLQLQRYERERAAWRTDNNRVNQEQSVKDKPSMVEAEQDTGGEQIYYDPDDFCIHGFLHGEGCYLHDPNHWYRKALEQRERAAA